MDCDDDYNDDYNDHYDDLDTSWIETAEFQDNYQRESIKNISIYFIYINNNGSIEHILKENEVIDNSFLSKERILQLIQIKRNSTNNICKKYKLMELLSFFNTLEPNQLNDFINPLCETEQYSSSPFFKTLPIFNDIIFDPSIFIFHDLNCLFFLFKETESFVTKSILKNGISIPRITKKVRISPDDYIHRKRKSFKKLFKINKKYTKKKL
jgi:hypothetical protein